MEDQKAVLLSRFQLFGECAGPALEAVIELNMTLGLMTCDEKLNTRPFELVLPLVTKSYSSSRMGKENLKRATQMDNKNGCESCHFLELKDVRIRRW